jgi:Protein of unknown function (DUF3618)
MTASERAGGPAERPAAEAETAPGTELSPQGTAAGDAPDAAPLTGTIAAPRDDPELLQQEIERTRRQLGETVQELAARADVKSRARAKAAEMTGRVKSTAAQARQAVTKGASSARERWMPLVAAAGVLAVGYLALRQRRRRKGDGPNALVARPGGAQLLPRPRPRA